MSDTLTPAGVAETVTVINKPKRSPSLINQAQARALTRAEFVGLAAKKDAYAPALAARDIDETAVDALLEEVGAGRDKAAEAVINTTAHREATAAEKTNAKKLEAGLREVQKAAKQKYARTNRIALADYLIGEKLNGSRSNLSSTSRTIITRVVSDKLPGFTSAKVKALAAQRQTWIEAQQTQTEAETASLNSRAELKTLLISVTDRRIAVQLAADAEWSHADEANAATRKEFSLPAKRPLKV